LNKEFANINVLAGLLGMKLQEWMAVILFNKFRLKAVGGMVTENATTLRGLVTQREGEEKLIIFSKSSFRCWAWL